MANVFSLCHDIEEFLQQNDSNSIRQFSNWIQKRLNLDNSSIFRCQCGHQYAVRIESSNEKHEQDTKKLDDLQSFEQLIPPDTIEREQTYSSRLTRFGLPKLTDSMVEIIHPDGKRQFRCPLCFNSYVNRSGLNRHYITHSSQDLWKVECQFCGKRYSRKDSLKHHIKTQHTQFLIPNWVWKEKEQLDNDDVVVVT